MAGITRQGWPTARRHVCHGGRRRGAVLIFVVALLVLLALIGVALIANTHTDRLGAASHVENVQLDLHADSVLNTAAGHIVAALSGWGNPALYRETRSSYQHSTASELQPWLAARTPVRVEVSPGVYEYYWPSISQSLAADGRFVDPTLPVGAPGRVFDYNALAALGTSGLRIETVAHNPPTSYLRLSVPESVGSAVARIAADTDGDGVPDALYFQIAPDVYIAVRIVDNNAALNLSTAEDWDDAALPGGAAFGWGAMRAPGYFTSHVGLGRVVDSAELGRLNRWRKGYAATSSGPYDSSLQPSVDYSVSPYWQLVGTGGGEIDLRYVFSSQGEALFFLLGRRPAMPLYNPASTAFYRAVPISESGVLAYRFVLKRPAAMTDPADHASMLEADMPTATGGRSAPYNPATELGFWWNNFAPVVGGLPALRSELVARNGVSNAIAPKSMTAVGSALSVPAGMASYSPALVSYATAPPQRTSINTADFPELWRAFWSVMAGDDPSDAARATPFVLSGGYTGATAVNTGNTFADDFTPTGTPNEQHMFRTSIRVDGSNALAVRLPPDQQLLLRAAIAAVNVRSLRQSNPPVQLTNTLQLRAVDGLGTEVLVNATVYGSLPQPYITEVYVNNDNETDIGGKNPNGYIAIELHNPHGAPIDMNQWKLAWRDRSTANNPTVIHTFAAGTVVPAGGYLVIDNLAAGGAVWRPAASGLPQTGALPAGMGISGLHQARNRELLVLRAGNANQEMPVDAFDLTGYPLTPTDAGAGNSPRYTPTAWHYVRANDAGQTPSKKFHCVYPGRYDATRLSRRQQGTREVTWGVEEAAVAETNDPWRTVPPTPGIALGSADGTASHPQSFAIQIHNTDFGGPNKPSAFGPNRYPYGQFARLGDILQAPYIGAYRITRVTGGTLVELNPVTMDAAMAEDSDTSTDSVEQIGRLCPLAQAGYAGPDTYFWAADLFDYFTTISAPHDDYSPHYSRSTSAPDAWPGLTSSVPRVRQAVNRRGLRVMGDTSTTVTTSVANSGNENTVPVEGLININTASARVLSTLPLVLNDSSSATPGFSQANLALAQAIVDYRRANGPFASIFELNSVPGFQAGAGDDVVDLAGGDPGTRQGDYAPAGGSDGVVGDFEARYLRMTRISNLVTTRSDHFRVYVLVEQWSNGAPVASRRLCADVDRSGVTQALRRADVYRLYSE